MFAVLNFSVTLNLMHVAATVMVIACDKCGTDVAVEHCSEKSPCVYLAMKTLWSFSPDLFELYTFYLFSPQYMSRLFNEAAEMAIAC